MHKNTIVRGGLPSVGMRLDMVDFGLRPDDRRFTDSTLLLVTEVNHFLFEWSEHSLWVFELKRLKELRHLFNVELMPVANTISLVSAMANPLSIAEPELVWLGRVL